MKLLLLVGAVLVLVGAGLAKTTVYAKNEHKNLEPVLIAVSSTVIPIPVYKVGYGLGVIQAQNQGKFKKPDGPTKLITVSSKKNKANQKPPA